MLRRFNGSERDVQDLAQKVFLIAYRKLDQFEGRSTVKTWLCGIALKVAADYRNSAVYRREMLFDVSIDLRSERDPERDLVQKERVRELDRILDTLPIEQRTVFVLFEFEQLTGEEIAQIVGASEGTVRSRLRLARRSFSRAIAERNRDDHPLARVGEP